MYCEEDKFTDADRAALRDIQHREKAQTRTVHGDIAMTYERREIFTFHADEVGTFRFDVRGIKEAIADDRIPARMYKIPEVKEDYHQHILHNGGVEPERLPRITGADLERPGLLVAWPNGYQTMIDGNHRLCRRMQLGTKSFRFLLVDVLHCVPWMCRPGDEEKLFKSDRPEGSEVLHTEIKVVET